MKIFKILLWPNTFCDSYYPNLPWALDSNESMWSSWLCYVQISKLSHCFWGQKRSACSLKYNSRQLSDYTAERSCCSGGQVVFTLASVRSLLTACLDKWKTLTTLPFPTGLSNSQAWQSQLIPDISAGHRGEVREDRLRSAPSWPETKTHYWGQRTGPLYLPQVNLNPFCLPSAPACVCSNVQHCQVTNRQVIGPWCASMSQ